MTGQAGSVDDKSARPRPKADRLTREAAALRANLLKRKDQARQREAAGNNDSEPLPRRPAPE